MKLSQAVICVALISGGLASIWGCSRQTAKSLEETSGRAIVENLAGRAEADLAAPADHLGRGQALPSNSMPMQISGNEGGRGIEEGLPADLGQGPGMGGDRHDPIVENPYQSTRANPLSTFSIDVDTASYAKVRSYLLGQSRLPRPDAVRIEELVNYFDYDTAGPDEEAPHPFATHVGLTDCPWQQDHKLARIAIKGREFVTEQSGPSNLVFLIDVSGSMKGENRLPLLKQAIGLLADKLGPRDTVSMVVYAGASGVVLDGAAGDDAEAILGALRRLQAGGSTNGGAGIELAYQLAREHFVEQGSNRVILCSDGDFNVGLTGTDQLVRLVERNARDGVFLTVLGFGMGNHNDAMLEQISGRGNGNYFFIDTIREARKVLVEDLHGTLVTIAKDVKIQIEFNPAKVAAYRLIGYENRMLEAQDFNDDQKDAGEIGAGHCVTALYELVPRGVELPAEMAPIEPLRYQPDPAVNDEQDEVASDEWLVIRLRYKQPDASRSEKLEFVVDQSAVPFADADADLRFAAAVAGFGMLLRESKYQGTASYDDVLQIAEAAVGEDAFGLRGEFCDLVRSARRLN